MRQLVQLSVYRSVGLIPEDMFVCVFRNGSSRVVWIALGYLLIAFDLHGRVIQHNSSDMLF